MVVLTANKGDLFMDRKTLEVFQVKRQTFMGWYSLAMIGYDDKGRSCTRETHESRLFDNGVYQRLSQ